MRFTYDKEANAAYIKFLDTESDITETQGEWPINVDLSGNGKVVGIEILDATTVLSAEYLERAEKLS